MVKEIMNNAVARCQQEYGVEIQWHIKNPYYSIPNEYSNLFAMVCKVYLVPFDDFAHSLQNRSRKRIFSDIKSCICKILREQYTMDYDYISILLNLKNSNTSMYHCKKYDSLLAYDDYTQEKYALALKYQKYLKYDM